MANPILIVRKLTRKTVKIFARKFIYVLILSYVEYNLFLIDQIFFFQFFPLKIIPAVLEKLVKYQGRLPPTCQDVN